MLTGKNFIDKMNMLLRLVAVYSLVLLFFVMNTIVLPYSLSDVTKASFFLMTLYYWSVYRPTLMPALATFVFGLLLDFLLGTPVGVYSFIFLLVQWWVSVQRRYLTSQNFPVIWVGFFLALLLEQFVLWSMTGWTGQNEYPPLFPVVVSMVYSMGLFPVVYVVLHMTHRLLPDTPPIKNFKVKR